MAVYFFLNSEDHRWPWLSFLASASTAIYVYIYAFFYFLVKTECVWRVHSRGCLLRSLVLFSMICFRA